MKNHFITKQITDLERFVVVMMTRPTIYVRSWHKVHSTVFFNKSKSFPVSKLQTMIDAGEFWECIKKSDVQCERIRALFETEETKKMAKIHAPTIDEAAAALSKLGSHGTTIGDIQLKVSMDRKGGVK